MPMLPIVAVTNEKTVKQLAEILNQFFTVSVVTDNIIKIETNSKVLLVNSNNIRELKLDDVSAYEIGKPILCDIFNEKDKVDVVGLTRGRGFTGVIQRWNQHRLKMTHGTGPVHREVGSTGANSTPSRVFKNRNMPGHYGHERVTIQNLEVVKVDSARNILLIKGCVPGPRGTIVTVKEAIKG